MYRHREACITSPLCDDFTNFLQGTHQHWKVEKYVRFTWWSVKGSVTNEGYGCHAYYVTKLICFAVSSPKRRELDKVMKKARRDGPMQSSYWNKKLLEVEEKDPNRFVSYTYQPALTLLRDALKCHSRNFCWSYFQTFKKLCKQLRHQYVRNYSVKHGEMRKAVICRGNIIYAKLKNTFFI
jgi:hypothetical protein